MNLNYKQLAFILNIEPVEALEKVLYCWAKSTGKSLPGRRDSVREYLFTKTIVKNKEKNVRNELPEALEIELLSKYLNLPDLQFAVDDIRENYLKRQASKKWILLDYPEKELRTKLKDKINIPPVLASLLKEEDVEFIAKEWSKRYGITI